MISQTTAAKTRECQQGINLYFIGEDQGSNPSETRGLYLPKQSKTIGKFFVLYVCFEYMNEYENVQ